MICAPSLIRVFAVRMKKHWDLSYSLSVQRNLWSVRADAQADLKRRWAHMSFCWFCRAAAQIVYCKYIVRIWSCTFWIISIFLDIDLFFFICELIFFLYFFAARFNSIKTSTSILIKLTDSISVVLKCILSMMLYSTYMYSSESRSWVIHVLSKFWSWVVHVLHWILILSNTCTPLSQDLG